MAEEIEARVRQKKDTLAGWNANSLVLLDGEQAFVVSDVDNTMITFKIGNGSLPFSGLAWPDLTVRDKASPSTTWAGKPSGVYIPTTSGTYNGSLAVDLTAGYVVLYWDGATLIQVIFPITLTGYLTAANGNLLYIKPSDLKGVNPTTGIAAVVGKNLYDLSKNINGESPSFSSGTIITGAGFIRSPFIKVAQSMPLTISGVSTADVFLLVNDVSGTLLHKYILNSGTTTITLEATADTVVFSINHGTTTANAATIQVEYGSSATAYEAYKPTLLTSIYGRGIKDLTAPFLTFNKVNNLLNESEIVVGSVSGSGALDTASPIAPWLRTGKVYVPVGVQCVFSATGFVQVGGSLKNMAFYNSSGGVISVVQPSNPPYIFTPPATTSYLMMTLKNNVDTSAPTNVQIEVGITPTTYAHYITPSISSIAQNTDFVVLPPPPSYFSQLTNDDAYANAKRAAGIARLTATQSTYFGQGARKKNVIHKMPIFLLAGQSQQDGRIPIADLPASWATDGNKIPFVQINNTDSLAWHEYNTTNFVDMGSGDLRFSYEVMLLKSLITYQRGLSGHANDQIFAVKKTLGGTGIDATEGDGNGRWSADTSSIPAGKEILLDGLETRTRAVVASTLYNTSFSPFFNALIFCQGEGDRLLGAPGRYLVNLTNMIAYVRGILGDAELPVIISSVNTSSLQYNSTVEAAKVTYVASDPLCFLAAATNGLGTLQADQIHWNITGGTQLAASTYNIIMANKTIFKIN